jgi:hypothetical protein
MSIKKKLLIFHVDWEIDQGDVYRLVALVKGYNNPDKQILERIEKKAAMVQFSQTQRTKIRLTELEAATLSLAVWRELEGVNSLTLSEIEWLLAHWKSLVTAGRWESDPQWLAESLPTEVILDELKRRGIDSPQSDRQAQKLEEASSHE